MSRLLPVVILLLTRALDTTMVDYDAARTSVLARVKRDDTFEQNEVESANGSCPAYKRDDGRRSRDDLLLLTISEQQLERSRTGR